MEKDRSRLRILCVLAGGGWLAAAVLAVALTTQWVRTPASNASLPEVAGGETSRDEGHDIPVGRLGGTEQRPWQWDSEEVLDESDIQGDSRLVRAFLGGRQFGRELPAPSLEDVEELKRRINAFASSPGLERALGPRKALLGMMGRPGLGPLVMASLVRLTDWEKYRAYQLAIKALRAGSPVKEEVLRYIVRNCPRGTGRMEAATVLSKAGHEEEMIGHMIAYLDLSTNHDWGPHGERVWVVRWLGWRSGEAVKKRLIKALKDMDPAIRLAALHYLHEGKDKFGTDWMSVTDKAWWRDTLWQAHIERVCAVQTCGGLIEARYLESPELVQLAITTFRAGGRDVPGVYQGHEIRTSLLFLLKQNPTLRSPEALSFVEECLSDPVPRVRETAANVLEQWETQADSGDTSSPASQERPRD